MKFREIWLIFVGHDFQAFGSHFSVRFETSGAMDVDDLKQEVDGRFPSNLHYVGLSIWKTKGEMVIHNSTSEERLAEILKSIDVDDVDVVERIRESMLLRDLELIDSQA